MNFALECALSVGYVVTAVFIYVAVMLGGMMLGSMVRCAVLRQPCPFAFRTTP